MSLNNFEVVTTYAASDKKGWLNSTIHGSNGIGTGGHSKDTPIFSTVGSRLVAAIAASAAAATLGGPFLGINILN